MNGQKRPQNAPRALRSQLGPGPGRFVANWARMARSWGSAAPRCAPSDARLGPVLGRLWLLLTQTWLGSGRGFSPMSVGTL